MIILFSILMKRCLCEINHQPPTSATIQSGPSARRRSACTGICELRSWGASTPPPIFSNLQESWSKSSYAARELVTVFSVTFVFLVTIVGQLIKTPPPTEGVSAHPCAYILKIILLILQSDGICFTFCNSFSQPSSSFTQQFLN